jgi:hypothetical protein
LFICFYVTGKRFFWDFFLEIGFFFLEIGKNGPYLALGMGLEKQATYLKTTVDPDQLEHLNECKSELCGS